MSGQVPAAPPALVLASRSPRRQEALIELGVPFRVVVSRVEETLPPAADATDPARIALAKARDIRQQEPDATILAGDTIVVLEGTALGKPASADDAMRMLKLLRGRKHEVVTALVVARTGTTEAAVVRCPLWMRDYGDDEIERYVRSGEPLDCAGAYDAHRLGAALVARVEGCIGAVIGFPLAQGAAMLEAHGVPAPRDPASVCSRLYGGRCLASDASTAAACFDRGSRPPQPSDASELG